MNVPGVFWNSGKRLRDRLINCRTTSNSATRNFAFSEFGWESGTFASASMASSVIPVSSVLEVGFARRRFKTVWGGAGYPAIEGACVHLQAGHPYQDHWLIRCKAVRVAEGLESIDELAGSGLYTCELIESAGVVRM